MLTKSLIDKEHRRAPGTFVTVTLDSSHRLRRLTLLLDLAKGHNALRSGVYPDHGAQRGLQRQHHADYSNGHCSQRVEVWVRG